MKTTMITLTIVAMAAASSLAQTQPRVTGTWVVEANTHQRKLQTVKFYSDSNQLLYTETIKGRLNINRKKVRQNLDKVLDSLITRSNYRQNNGMLAAALKR